MAFFIAFSPYLFYLYEIFPDGPIWENSFFIYESKYFKSVNVAMWTFLGKVTPLFLLSIWFFTCKHWWYHAILIPISMYVYQLIIATYQDVFLHEIYMDVDGLIYLAPFFFIILVILYTVRIQIFDRIYGIDLSELNETDVSIFSSGLSKNHETDLEHFRNQNPFKSEEPTEDYYRKL